MNLSRGKVFIKEILGSFLFFGGERVYFPNLWGKGVIEDDLVIIRSGRGNVVGGLFGKYRGERGVFRGERRFGFGFLCCCGKFRRSGQLGNDQGSCWDKVGSTSNDLVDGAILPGVRDVLTLGFPVVVGKEVLIYNGIDVSVSWGFNGWSEEAGFVSLSLDGERAEKFLGLVEGFFDGEGLFDPVDQGVDLFQPRKS